MARHFGMFMRMRPRCGFRVRVKYTVDENVTPARKSSTASISFIALVLTTLVTAFQLWDHVSSAITTVF